MIRRVYRPTTLAELWPLLADGALVMAGGTDLLVRRRGLPPVDVVLLEGVGALAEVSQEDGLLRLGAMASHGALAASRLVRSRLPVLAKALSTLGSPQIRAMGTLGGNIATASPAGDSLPPLFALEAQVELASKDGRRRMPISELILGPGQTALLPGEIIVAVLVRPPEADALQHYEKVGRRNALAIAVVSLAAVVSRDAEGRVVQARLAVGSVGPTVVRCTGAEAALMGRELSRDSLLEAGARIREAIRPIDDVRATAAYRRQVAGNLLLRLAATG